MSTQSQSEKSQVQTTTEQSSSLDRLLSVVDKLKPASDQARKEIQGAVTTLFEHILDD